MDPILAALTERLNSLVEERKALKDQGDKLISTVAEEKRSQLNEDESREFVKVADQKRKIDTEIETVNASIADREDELKRDAKFVENITRAGTKIPYDAVGRVQTEERTYMPHKDQRGAGDGGTSFIHDIYAYQFNNDLGARERLERHSREAVAEGELNPREKRAVTTAGFAGLVVPQYLTQLAALVARNGRPFANSVTRLPLPDQGMNLIVPRQTTGVTEASQATENTAVSNTDQVWSAALSVPVNTIAGASDLSRQSIERGIPGLDQLTYTDLAGAYAAEVDRQIIATNGTGNTATGIEFAGGNQATAFGAAATATTFWAKLSGAVNAIEAAGTVVAPANLIVMHPRRWSWILMQVDTAGRPLATPVTQGLQVFNGFGVDVAPGQYSGDSPTTATGAVIKGYLQGLPVITDANVPTSIGTGPEDLVFVVNTQHCLLWENGDGMPQQLRFEQTLGTNLTVKLIAYNYIAFTAARYPAGVSIIGGNAGTAGFGLIAPTF